MLRNSIKVTLAALFLIMAYAIPVTYYLWATIIAKISWESWAGVPLFMVVIGPLACFFAIATFVYWWEIIANKSLASYVFPVICMILSLSPIILYITVWLAN